MDNEEGPWLHLHSWESIHFPTAPDALLIHDPYEPAAQVTRSFLKHLHLRCITRPNN